jgi:phosphoribosylformimino-5-aminoimidazole carboxamide ribonucleotide (ProFAR) isomerase
VPAACEENAQAIRSALTRAPGDVRLSGGVRISSCFQQAASPADVQNLGAIFVDAADALAARVRAAPHSHAAVELGYLIGAVRRGARTDTGVHYESERRVEQELAGVPTGTPEFRRGLEAGRRAG